MAMYNQLPVYKATYDLLLFFYGAGRNLQRDYRYTLGEITKKELMEILVLIYRASGAKQKGAIVAEAREKMVVVKLYLRLLHDLKQISLKVYADASMMADSVSKQLAAWQKSCDGKSAVV